MNVFKELWKLKFFNLQLEDLKNSSFKDRIDYILSSLAIGQREMIREQYIHVLTSHSSKYNISEFFVNFYWSLFALQYCVSFSHTTKRISYIYTYTPSVWIFFPFSSPWSNEFPVLYSWFSLVILLCVCTHTHMHTRA